MWLMGLVVYLAFAVAVGKALKAAGGRCERCNR
jgi:hypothetical protein